MPPSSPAPGPRPVLGPGAAFFRVLLESQHDAIVVAGPDGVVRYATSSATRILGKPAVTGARLQDLVGDAARDDAALALDRLPGEPAPAARTWQLPGDDGQPVYAEVRVSDLRAEPAVGGFVLTMRDVTVQRQREDDLHRRAFHDPLTGLANRALFDELAGQAMSRARREGRIVAVMLGDLDGFKAVNDTLGHPAGDELLIAVAEELRRAVRDSDAVARLGGDEFAVLLDGLPGRDAAGIFASRIVDVFRAPLKLRAGTARVGISVGVAVSDGGTDMAELVVQADRALYAAKVSGKRTWREYAPGMPAAGQQTAAGPGGLSGLGFPSLVSSVAPWWHQDSPAGPGGRIRPGGTGVRNGQRRGASPGM